MPEDFETVLRTGAQAVAEATKPVPAGLVRARGDRQRRRRLGASVVAAIAVIAGGAAAVGGLTGQHGHRAPVISPTGFSLRLTAPSSYALSVPNRVWITIDDSVGARTVMVEIVLGRIHYAIYHRAIVERFDQATGRWRSLRVTHTRSGWIASYRLRVGIGLTSQRLLVVPADPVAASLPLGLPPLTVVIRSGGRVVTEQRTRAAAVAGLAGTWDGSQLVAPIGQGQTREFDATIRNSANVGFPVQLRLIVGFCTGSHGCGHAPRGYQFQWFDARAWQAVTASAYQYSGGDAEGELLRTVELPPGGSVTIRFRITVGPAASSMTGLLILSASPDQAALPGLPALYHFNGVSIHTPPISAG